MAAISPAFPATGPTVPHPIVRRRSQSEQPSLATVHSTQFPVRKVDASMAAASRDSTVRQLKPTTAHGKYGKLAASPKLAGVQEQKGARRVLFSTPQPRPVDNGVRFTSAAKEIPPPYTPINMLSKVNIYDPPAAPFVYGRPAPQFANARMGPSYPATSLSNPSFQAVMAASEALRINLGLEPNQPVPPQAMMPFASPAPLPFGLGGARIDALASLPGAPVMPPPSVYNKTPSTSVQTQLLSSLFPVSGQVQPAISQSSTLPPIVNTGANGPMKVQPGDWSCLVCAFVNWRRRKYCMRCCPFAEGNGTELSTVNTTPPPISNAVPHFHPGLPLHPGMPAHATLPQFSSPAPFFGEQYRMDQQIGPAIGMQGLPVLPLGIAQLPYGQPAFVDLHMLNNMQPAFGFTSAPSMVGTEYKRPLTPSPTGSESSAFSFAFSGSSAFTSSPETLAISPPSSQGSASPATPKLECFEATRSSPKLVEAFTGMHISNVA